MGAIMPRETHNVVCSIIVPVLISSYLAVLCVANYGHPMLAQYPSTT